MRDGLCIEQSSRCTRGGSTDMADKSNSTSGKAGAFNRMYFFVLAALIIVMLGLYLFFASTRQSHGPGAGSGTQKSMIATSGMAAA